MSTQKNPRRSSRSKAPQPAKAPAPEVVYTQPKPFQSKRLLLQLATVFAVVLAIFLGLSVFFKVDTVMVSGADKYSADTVWDASGIQKGDSLLFFGRAATASQLKKALPYIDTVRFGIKLPGTVMIIIEEVQVVYAIKAVDESWWLISSQGLIIEKADAAAASSCTQITGVRLEDPQPGKEAVAYQPPQEPGNSDPVTVLASDSLAAALEVARQLEANDLLGTVTTMDAGDPSQLEFWYGRRFQVKLGDASRLDYKIAAVKEMINTLGQQRTGILDASFTTYPDKVWYGPLEEN